MLISGDPPSHVAVGEETHHIESERAEEGSERACKLIELVGRLTVHPSTKTVSNKNC